MTRRRPFPEFKKRFSLCHVNTVARRTGTRQSCRKSLHRTEDLPRSFFLAEQVDYGYPMKMNRACRFGVGSTAQTSIRQKVDRFSPLAEARFRAFRLRREQNELNVKVCSAVMRRSAALAMKPATTGRALCRVELRSWSRYARLSSDLYMDAAIPGRLGTAMTSNVL